MKPLKILILAGPNGAGKTTFAREYLPLEAECRTFVNADLIAAGLSPFEPERAAMQAARLTLQAIHHNAASRQSFAFETTLSGMGYARLIPQWRRAGYRVELIFLSLPSADAAVARVAQRVAQGGHHIPEEVVRRRFAAGRRLFEEVYKPLVDLWVLYENAGASPSLSDWHEALLPKAKHVAEEPEALYGELRSQLPDQVRDSFAALQRAALRARQTALQTGTPLILVQDGQVVRVAPQEMQAEPSVEP